MKCLALDCSLGATSVAFSSGLGMRAVIHDDYIEHPPGQHDGRAEALMPMLAALSQRIGGFASVDRIAVTVGPGSFTGVRVGMAAAHGLGLALGRPVVGLSSLAAIAHRADSLLRDERLGVVRRDAILAVMIDARRDALYCQFFAEDVAEPLGSPSLATPAAAAAFIASLRKDDRIIAVGSGSDMFASAARSLGLNVETTLPKIEPHARYLAQLAPALQAADAREPLYLRPPDARPQADQSLPRQVEPTP